MKAAKGTGSSSQGSPGTIPRQLVMRHSGIELLRMMIAGQLPAPPMAHTLNFSLVEAEEGRVIFRGEPLPEFFNPLGAIHGGWAATLLDSALGSAVHAALPVATGYSTIEYKVNLVRPILPETGEVICEGRLVHLGRTIATSQATLTTTAGKLLAHGTETCAILPFAETRK